LGVYIALGLLIIEQKVCADENLPLLKTSNEVYSNVTVLSATPTDVYFTYNNGHGMANAKLENLSPELQKHFHYNATNALTLEKKQTEANAQYHAYLISLPAPAPHNQDRSATPPAAAHAPKILWRMDLPGALSQARSDNKLVLLDFTGSDWCPWCIKFDHDILSTGQFASYANAKLVLVKLDFPRSTPQSDDLKRANAELKNRFQVDGFPTYVLLNASGNELGRQVGYLEGGPNAFIAELESFSKR
jgi:thiol:disulfide interchange protein